MQDPFHDPVPLEIAKLLGQHTLADFGHQAAKVVEAQRAVRDQRVDDCRLPLARDDPHDHLDSLDRIVWVCGARLSHGGICPPTIRPYFKRLNSYQVTSLFLLDAV